jgi:hypothetical protein
MFSEEGLDQEIERFRYGDRPMTPRMGARTPRPEFPVGLFETLPGSTPRRSPSRSRSRSRAAAPPKQKPTTRRDPAHQKNFRNHLATYKRELQTAHKNLREQYAEMVIQYKQVQERVQKLFKKMNHPDKKGHSDAEDLLKQVDVESEFLQAVSTATQLKSQILIVDQQMQHVEGEMAKYGAPKTLYAHRQRLQQQVQQHNRPANQKAVVQGLNIVASTYLTTAKH